MRHVRRGSSPGASLERQDASWWPGRAPAPSPAPAPDEVAPLPTGARPPARRRRGRPGRWRGDLEPQARRGCGSRRRWARATSAPLDDARARPRHGLRGGRLPEHLRVLGRRHGDLHDQRRALHASLRLLPGRHAPPAAARPGRARARRRGGRPDGARRTPSSPPSPATTSPTGGGRLRRDDRRDPPPQPGHDRRGAHPGLQGRRGRPRDRSSTPVPTCSTTTSRRCSACSVPCAPRPPTPAACRCSARSSAAGLTTKSGIILGMGETRGRGRRRARRPRVRSASRSSRSASTCARPRPTCRSPAGGPRRSSTSWRRRRRAMGFAHVEASPLTRSSYHAKRAVAAPEPPAARSPSDELVSRRGPGAADAAAGSPGRRASRGCATAMSEHGCRRAAALARRRPALAHRLRGDAARAA